MGKTGIQLFDDSRNGLFSVSDLGFDSSLNSSNYHPIGGLVASVNTNPFASLSSPDLSNRGNTSFSAQLNEEEEQLVDGEKRKMKKKDGLKLKIKIANPSLRRLLSGAVAGAVSRTVVAPLETIRTHLMVGSGGNSSTQVFGDIMKHEGWTGLFRGNLVNVIRVAPARAVEVPQWLLDIFVNDQTNVFRLSKFLTFNTNVSLTYICQKVFCWLKLLCQMMILCLKNSPIILLCVAFCIRDRKQEIVTGTW